MSTPLMIPGPVPLEDQVAAELASPAEAHYGAEWAALYCEMIDLLRKIFQTAGDVFCLTSSGSGGLDAAMGSLLWPGAPVVIGVNGFFGNRLAEIARAHGAQVTEVVAEWGSPLRPSDFEEALNRATSPALIAATFVETSTGVVNPIRELAEVANRAAIPFLVDAVSALGGVEFAMDEWGVDLCVTASQKCLGGPAGLAPVAVGPRAWEAIEKRPPAGRSWYLDLKTWRQYAEAWGKWHPYPVTVPTQSVRALRAGLQSIIREGLEARIARFGRLSNRLRSGLRDLGFELLAEDAWAAPVVTAVRSPRDFPPGEVQRYLEQEHGIRISGGLGELAGKIFRIGHMAPAITAGDIEQTLGALQDLLRRRAAPDASGDDDA